MADTRYYDGDRRICNRIEWNKYAANYGNYFLFKSVKKYQIVGNRRENGKNKTKKVDLGIDKEKSRLYNEIIECRKEKYAWY